MQHPHSTIAEGIPNFEFPTVHVKFSEQGTSVESISSNKILDSWTMFLIQNSNIEETQSQ